MPLFIPETTTMFKIGIILWYSLVGAFIGLMGVMNYNPVLKIKMNAWFRGILVGGFMNLVLVLIAYDVFVDLMANATAFTGMSPFWFVLEGAIVGVIIDLIATKHSGEGPGIVVGLGGSS